MRINDTIPDFKVSAFHNGEFKTVTREDLRGKWAIFYFYPADFTFVCPTELADLAEQHEALKAMNVEVMSVSTDTHFTHMAWHGSSPMIKTVNYAMLADPTGHLTRAFGVHIEEAGLAYRGTFIVDPQGKVKVMEIHDNGIGRSAIELVRKVQAAQYVATNPTEVCPANWKPGAKTLTPGANLVGKL